MQSVVSLCYLQRGIVHDWPFQPTAGRGSALNPSGTTFAYSGDGAMFRRQGHSMESEKPGSLIMSCLILTYFTAIVIRIVRDFVPGTPPSHPGFSLGHGFQKLATSCHFSKDKSARPPF